MIGDRFERPAFAVVSDYGYDQAQVDAYLAEQTPWEVEAHGRVQEIAATMSELEGLAEASRRDRFRVYELLRQAEADRDEAEQRAAKILEAAHVSAAELFEASRAERQEVEQLVEEARRQVDWFVEEVEAAVERGAVAVMTHSQPRLDEIRRGFDLLDAQRQAVLGNLFRLRETLDGLAVEMLRAG